MNSTDLSILDERIFYSLRRHGPIHVAPGLDVGRARARSKRRAFWNLPSKTEIAQCYAFRVNQVTWTVLHHLEKADKMIWVLIMGSLRQCKIEVISNYVVYIGIFWWIMSFSFAKIILAYSSGCSMISTEMSAWFGFVTATLLLRCCALQCTNCAHCTNSKDSTPLSKRGRWAFNGDWDSICFYFSFGHLGIVPWIPIWRGALLHCVNLFILSTYVYVLIPEY